MVDPKTHRNIVKLKGLYEQKYQKCIPISKVIKIIVEKELKSEVGSHV